MCLSLPSCLSPSSNKLVKERILSCVTNDKIYRSLLKATVCECLEVGQARKLGDVIKSVKERELFPRSINNDKKTHDKKQRMNGGRKRIRLNTIHFLRCRDCEADSISSFLWLSRKLQRVINFSWLCVLKLFIFISLLVFSRGIVHPKSNGVAVEKNSTRKHSGYGEWGTKKYLQDAGRIWKTSWEESLGAPSSFFLSV